MRHWRARSPPAARRTGAAAGASTGRKATSLGTGSGCDGSAWTVTATPFSSRSSRRVPLATRALAPASTTAASGRPMPERRRLFGPVFLAGAAGSGVCALAGAKPWAEPDVHAGPTLVDSAGGRVPLAAALGLAGLACWGVVLVTRRTVRRLVAALGAVVAVGLV